MPVVADDLGGLGLYGWVFSGFFLGNLLGIVIAGPGRRPSAAPRSRSSSAWCCSRPASASAAWRRRWACSSPLACSRASAPAPSPPSPTPPSAASTPPPSGRGCSRCSRPRGWCPASSARPRAAPSRSALSWRAVFLALLPVRRARGRHHDPGPHRRPRGGRRRRRRAGARSSRGRRVVLTLSVALVLVAISGPPAVDRRPAAPRRDTDRRADVHPARAAGHAAPGARHARGGHGARHPHVRVLRRRRLRLAHLPGRARPADLGRRRRPHRRHPRLDRRRLDPAALDPHRRSAPRRRHRLRVPRRRASPA